MKQDALTTTTSQFADNGSFADDEPGDDAEESTGSTVKPRSSAGRSMSRPPIEFARSSVRERSFTKPERPTSNYKAKQETWSDAYSESKFEMAKSRLVSIKKERGASGLRHVMNAEDSDVDLYSIPASPAPPEPPKRKRGRPPKNPKPEEAVPFHGL